MFHMVRVPQSLLGTCSVYIVRFGQFRNALMPTLMPFGISIEPDRLVQPIKAWVSIRVRLFGRVILVSLVLCANAEERIVVSWLFGAKVMLVKPVFQNAQTSISVTVAGIAMLFRLKHS